MRAHVHSGRGLLFLGQPRWQVEHTILEIFENRVNQSGTDPALRSRADHGWEAFSWNEWWDRAERVAAGLIELGLSPGDRVGILSRTRSEWVIADIAILMAGGVSVPLYPSSLPATCMHIIHDSKPSHIFVEDPSQLDKLADVRGDIPSVKSCIVFDDAAVFPRPDWRGRREVRLSDIDVPSHWQHTLDTLESEGRRALSTNLKKVVSRRRQVEADDLATIVYTSGTSAMPRGVELTHRNLATEVASIESMGFLSPNDVQLLFLPLAHIFARVLYLSSIGYGLETVMLKSVDRLVERLVEVRPTFFAGVPQIFEQIRSQILIDAHRHGGLKASLFEHAVEVGKRLSEAEQGGREAGLLDRAQEKILRELVFGRIHDLFGKRIRFLVSGGAPLAVEVSEFFHAAGILILEGYGLTESCAVASVNTPDEFRLGSVGRPLPGVEITIEEDGEILIRGETVMRGYHNERGANQEVFDEDGWMHTGDLGRYDRDGFLWITGRKKDMLVTAGGKNIAPQPIERRLIASPYISQAVVIGDSRPFVAALIGLRVEAIRARLAEEGVQIDGPMDEHPRVRKLIATIMHEVNDELSTYQTVKRFEILPRDLEAAELTPTNKVRRQVVLENYGELIDRLYAPSHA